jgi:hypothetical protein
MAIRASAFDEVGGFDDRFFLYFEENDFLRRIAERRMRIVYVPAARCRHIYNQSAAQSAEAAALYAESERRYLAKWNEPFLAGLLKRLERPSPGLRPPSPRVAGRGDYLVEASPLASFDTAAGHFTSSANIDLPHEIWETYRGNVLYLRVIERDTGRVVAADARYKS